MTTNAGATWVRLLGCERPRKYVSEVAASVLTAASGTTAEGRASADPRPWRTITATVASESSASPPSRNPSDQPGIGSVPKPLTEYRRRKSR